MTVQLYQIEKIQRYCQTKKRPESVLAAFELSFAPCPTSSSITSQFAGNHQSIACCEQPEDHMHDRNTRNITKYSFWITPINIQKSRVANKHANHFCCLIFCIGSFWALRYSSVFELRLGTLGEHSDTFLCNKKCGMDNFSQYGKTVDHTFWHNLFGSCYLQGGVVCCLMACSISSMTCGSLICMWFCFLPSESHGCETNDFGSFLQPILAFSGFDDSTKNEFSCPYQFQQEVEILQQVDSDGSTLHPIHTKMAKDLMLQRCLFFLLGEIWGWNQWTLEVSDQSVNHTSTYLSIYDYLCTYPSLSSNRLSYPNRLSMQCRVFWL